MKFETAYVTNIGKKAVNQDSLLIIQSRTCEGPVVFAAICDGMGGIQKGELASAEVIRAFEGWFQSKFPLMLENTMFTHSRLFFEWDSIIQELNKRLVKYGQAYKIEIGTTIAAFLLFRNRYYIVNVGDSRVYEISEQGIQCITKDHSLVMQEVEQGRLSIEAIEHDPRRSILLQCIGVSGNVKPDFFTGTINQESVYMICCDGFRHEILPEEFYELLRPSEQKKGGLLQEHLRKLLEMNLSRNEQDNITAVAVLRLR